MAGAAPAGAVYPAMKQLTLDLAATSFLGADIGPYAKNIDRAFVDMVAAAVAVIRRPLPGTKMARGVRGRQRIVAYFSEQIPIRRAKGDGEDLFSELCRATHEDGALLPPEGLGSSSGRLPRHAGLSLPGWIKFVAFVRFVSVKVSEFTTGELSAQTAFSLRGGG